MRVTANSTGSSATARMIVVMLSIGAPMTNDRMKFVDAPRRTNDGAITEEQHEQNGCGSANRTKASGFTKRTASGSSGSTAATRRYITIAPATPAASNAACIGVRT